MTRTFTLARLTVNPRAAKLHMIPVDAKRIVDDGITYYESLQFCHLQNRNVRRLNEDRVDHYLTQPAVYPQHLHRGNQLVAYRLFEGDVPDEKTLRDQLTTDIRAHLGDRVPTVTHELVARRNKLRLYHQIEAVLNEHPNEYAPVERLDPDDVAMRIIVAETDGFIKIAHTVEIEDAQTVALGYPPEQLRAFGSNETGYSLYVTPEVRR